MKYVIVNADDFGVSHEINYGIADCFKRGVVTNASLVVNEEWTKEAVQLAKKLKIPLGLHLNLFSGSFPSDMYSIFGVNSKVHVVLQEWEGGHRRRTYLAEEDFVFIRLEFERQIKLFEKMLGAKPNHLNYHYGLHFIPQVFDVYVEVAQHTNLPFRYGKQYSPLPLYTRHADRWIDSFHGPQISLAHFLHILDEIKDGVNEISVHPAYMPKGSRDFDDIEHARELKILFSPEISNAFKARNITLTDFSIFSK